MAEMNVPENSAELPPVPEVFTPDIAPVSLEPQPKPQTFTPIQASDYSQEEQEKLVSDFLSDPQNASFESFVVAGELRQRQIASAYARYHATEGTKAANRKDWAARTLNLPIGVVNANPDYAIAEAEYIDFKNKLQRQPLLLEQFSDARWVKLWTAKDPEALADAQSIFGSFSNGFSIAQLDHERNQVANKIVSLHLDGKPVPESLIQRRNKLTEQIQEKSQYGEGVSSLLGGIAGSVFESVSEATPYAAYGASLGYLLEGIGAIPGAAIGFTTGFAKDTIDQLRGTFYNELVAQGVSPETAVQRANSYGLSIGALESLADLITGGIFGKSLMAVRSAVTQQAVRGLAGAELKNALRDIGLNTVAGGVFGGIEQMGINEALATSGVQVEKTKGVLDSVYQGALTNAIAGVELGAPNLVINGTNYLRSARQLNRLQQLQEKAGNTDLVKSNPDAAADMYNQMAAESDMRFVQISPAFLQQAMQQHPDDVQVLRDAMPELDKQLQDAQAAGTEIQIDMGTWLAKLSQTELGKSLSDYVRVGGDGMTLDEMRTIASESGLDNDLQQTVKRMADEESKALAKDNAIDAIQKDIEINLKNAGVSIKGSRQGAKLYTAFISTMADRLGKDADTFYKDLALKFALKADDPKIRGSYDFRSGTVFLNEHSDASTVAHEGAHFFLDVLTRMSRTNSGLDGTMNTLTNWFGISRGQWDNMSDEQRRPYHEKFAENWEKYLRTAQAPTKPLKRMFSFYSDWIGNAYRSIKQDNTPIPDDVRAIFDSLLATDEQMLLLREAEVDRPLLVGEAVNFLSPEQKVEYRTAIEEHFQDLKAELSAAQVKEYTRLRRKRDAFMTSLDYQYRKVRKQYGHEAERNVRNRPAYRIVDLATRGAIMVGEDTVTNSVKMKIDRKSARRYVDSVTLTQLGKRRLLTDEGGYPIEEIADFVEAQDIAISDLLRTLATQPSMKQAIENEVDRLALRTHSALATPEGRTELANTAFASTGANRMYSLEISALLRGNTPAREINRLAQGVAERVFNRLKQKDISERSFHANEQRQSRKALQALKKGDVAAAARHRYYALINRKMMKMATDFKAEKRRMVDIVHRLHRMESSTAYDLNWILVAEHFAKALGMYRRDILPVGAMEDLNPRAYQALQEIRMGDLAQPIEQMSVEQLHDAFIDLQGYVEKARQEKRFTIRGKSESLEEATKALLQPLEREEFKNKRGELDWGVKGSRGLKEDVISKVYSFANSTKTAETLFEHFDGATKGSAAGEWISHVFLPLREASTRGTMRINEARKRIINALSAMDLTRIGSDPLKFVCAATGEEYDFNAGGRNGLNELTVLLLNMGNVDNARKALLGGRTQQKGADPNQMHPWAVLREDGSVDATDFKNWMRSLIRKGKLDKDYFLNLQKIFDEFKRIRPDLQKARYQVEGKYFKEIPAEFQLNDVLREEFGIEIDGGYFPAIYDSALSQITADKDVQSLMMLSNAVYLPQAPHSFFKERSTGPFGGISLNINLIDATLNRQIWYAEVQPTLTQVDKLLRQPPILSALRRVSPGATPQIIQPWLQTIARNGALPVSDMPETTKLIAGLNSRATQNIMFANLTNIAQQVTGFITAMPYVGTTNTLRGIARVLGNIGTRDLRAQIEALSPQMKLRWSREDEKLAAQLDKALGMGFFKRQARISVRNAYIGQSLFQRPIDMAIWHGAFNEFKHKNPLLSDKEAAAYADGVIVKTQSSSRPEDRAAIQNVNNAWAKAFGAFFAYFVSMRNLNPAVGYMWQRALGLRHATPTVLAAYLSVIVVPMALGEMISKTMRGQWPEDDEEFQKEILDTLTGTALTAGFSTWVPYVGGYAASSIRRNVLGQDVYVGDSPLNSPALNAVETVLKGAYSLADDEWDARDVQGFLQTLSYCTGIAYPAGLARPAAGLYDMIDKNDFSQPFSSMMAGKVPEN